MTHQSLYPPTDAPDELRISGMRAAVKMVRDCGRKLSPEEFAAAPVLEGELFAGPVHRYRTGGGASTFAELHVAGKFVRPLWNPAVANIDVRGILLSGYELHRDVTNPSDPTAVVKRRQAWLIVPL